MAATVSGSNLFDGRLQFLAFSFSRPFLLDGASFSTSGKTGGDLHPVRHGHLRFQLCTSARSGPGLECA